MTEQAAPEGANAAGPDGAAGILRPVRGRLLLSLALVAVSAAAGVVPLVGIVELARALLPGGSGSAGHAWAVVWVIVVSLAVRLAALLAAAWVSHAADLDLGMSVRRQLVGHLGRVPLGWFTDRNSGLVKKAVEDDVAALHQLVAHAVLEVTAAVCGPVIAIAYLFAVDWRMTLITLAPLLAAAGAYAWAMRGATAKFVEYDASMAALGSAGVEFINGIAVIKAFGGTVRAHRRYATAADRFADYYRGWMLHSARGMLAMELAMAPVTTLLVVLIGAVGLASTGSLAPVNAVPFVVLGLGLTAPLLTVGASAQAMREATQAAQRIATLLREPVLSEPPAGGPRPAGGRVEFRDVCFAYGDTEVLHKVSAVLEPGTVTALVGPSGSGKSTLARLLPRFADVCAGSVTIGGVDIRQLPAARLYEQVSFVFQDVSLLRTTVRDNIRLAHPNADDEAVRAAAAAAQIADRIEELPDGYDTMLGQGTSLSGGEAQRVAIARALLADTPILVLDEATAAADPESESRVQQALSTLVAGRTLLVIAHRLSTVTGADQILVLDGGRIAERGRHPDLLAAGGLYARLWAADQRATVTDLAGEAR